MLASYGDVSSDIAQHGLSTNALQYVNVNRFIEILSNMISDEFTSQRYDVHVIVIPAHIRAMCTCQHLMAIVDYHNYGCVCYERTLERLSETITHIVTSNMNTSRSGRRLRRYIRNVTSKTEQWFEEGQIPLHITNLYHSPHIKRLLDAILQCANG